MKNLEDFLTPWFKITCDRKYFTTSTKFKIRQIVSQTLKQFIGAKYKTSVKQNNFVGGTIPILNYIVEFEFCTIILRATFSKHFLCLDAFWFNYGNHLTEELQENFIDLLRSEIVDRTLYTGVPIDLFREINWDDVSYHPVPPKSLKRDYNRLVKNFKTKNKKPSYTQKPVYLRKR